MFNKKSRRPYVVAGLLISLILLTALAGCSLSNAPSKAVDKATPAPVQTADTQKQTTTENEGKDLVISVGDVSEEALFIPAEVDGVKLEVIAVKAPDGSIRTAFNTCQVCYDCYFIPKNSSTVFTNSSFSSFEPTVTRNQPSLPYFLLSPRRMIPFVSA